jgi:hypothetical protein
MVAQSGTDGQQPRAEVCKHCGVLAVPTLSKGTPPHAIKASCPACGKFLKWISTLAPAERMARKMKYKLAAMQRQAPTEMQLSFLQALGDRLSPPTNKTEASARIEALKSKKGKQ